MMITKEQYLASPCRAASVPYWKTKTVTLPDGMKVLHQEDFKESEYRQYMDEPYFRLSHDLQGLSAPALPDGFRYPRAIVDMVWAATLFLSCCTE